MIPSFKKYGDGPIFGGDELGTCFDVYVWRDNGRYRMDFSWRTNLSLAVTFSDDGIHWEPPQVTLPPDPNSGWEDKVNRNCVLKVDDKYKMWYTGQARGHSFIGYAESDDGIHFQRIGTEPVLYCERAWEGFSVMNPCVLYENGKYRMWYAAGETYEPNVLAYAESADGIHWRKSPINPIYVKDKNAPYECNRVGGCQVVKTEDMGYVMLYIGYADIHTACICAAHSPDGITRWERSSLNPLVVPTPDGWDGDACYKPAFLWNEDTQQWMLWYNGRVGRSERIGFATKDGRELFAPQK